MYGLPCEDHAKAVMAAPPPPSPPTWRSTDGPLAGAQCVESDSGSRYVTAVYWALMTISTVGYGDVTAQTDLEKISASFTMLFGALVFAAITGQMASRFMATKGASQIFNTKMDEIRQYLRDNNVSKDQRIEIEMHFSALWGKSAIYDESEILALLPRCLRDPLLEGLYSNMIGNVGLFSLLTHEEKIPQGTEILCRISQMLTHTVANFGLVMMKEGEYSQVSDFSLSDIFTWYLHCTYMTYLTGRILSRKCSSLRTESATSTARTQPSPTPTPTTKTSVHGWECASVG